MERGGRGWAKRGAPARLRTWSADSVALMRLGRLVQRPTLLSTKWQSSWMLWNSLLSCALRMRVLACVIAPRLKSKTSSERSLKMCMEFSHRFSDVFDAPTSSGMNAGHLAGQSFFSTCAARGARCLGSRCAGA